MPPPTTARGLLGHFPRGPDPPATDQCASPPTVQSPTYLSLREILADGAGGRAARDGRAAAGDQVTAGVGAAGQGEETGMEKGRQAARRGRRSG